MSEKLPVHGFKLVRNTSQFNNKDFIKNWNEESDDFFKIWCSIS